MNRALEAQILRLDSQNNHVSAVLNAMTCSKRIPNEREDAVVQRLLEAHRAMCDNRESDAREILATIRDDSFLTQYFPKNND